MVLDHETMERFLAYSFHRLQRRSDPEARTRTPFFLWQRASACRATSS